MKGISILGSTGSIGRSCLKVIESLPQEFRIVGLAAGNNTDLLGEQIEQFHPQVVSVSSSASAESLSRRLGRLPSKQRPRVVSGTDGLTEVATHIESQLVVSAIVGVTGLLPTYEAVRQGKTVALANKEILVVAGEPMMRAAQEHHVDVLPIDSEHSAIHQCLRSGRREEIRRIILTASGGPFRSLPQDLFDTVTPQMALQHPTWNMGDRVTIDSATLMNKGFEVLEAQWLFGFPVEMITVLIHPQSMVHSMVEFIDGSIVAQMGVTDMRHPIQYALTYPERMNSPLAGLDFSRLPKLEFMEPDLEKFPCLALAFQAARQLGGQPCVLNAADEVVVAAFLEGKIGFLDIPAIVRRMMDLFAGTEKPETVEKIMRLDEKVRKETDRLIEKDYVRCQ